MILLSWNWLLPSTTTVLWNLPTFRTLARCCLMASPVTSQAGDQWTVSIVCTHYNATCWSKNRIRDIHIFCYTDMGSTPAKLQVAPINVVEHAVCSTPEWWGSIALETMLCAGGDGIISGCHVRSLQGQQFFTQCESDKSESRCSVHVFSLFRATLEVPWTAWLVESGESTASSVTDQLACATKFLNPRFSPEFHPSSTGCIL